MPPKKRRTLLSPRTAKASAARARRARETHEETALRLSQTASRYAAAQASETTSDRSTRLARVAAYRSSLRSRLTKEQQSSQNMRASYCASIRRARENPEQRAIRNAANATSTARTRSVETSQQRRTRQDADAANKAMAKAAETPQQRRARQAANAANTARARSAETPHQRTIRTSRHAINTASARASEGAEARAERLSRDATATAVARASESAEARCTRLESINKRRDIIRGVRTPAPAFWLSLAFNYDATINFSLRDDIKIGSMTIVCQFCKAKKWPGEPPGLCCSGGKVDLPPLREPPQPLKDLAAGLTPDSSQFLEIIRKYNCSFQMTSFGAKIPPREGWMPTFKVQGQVYHLIGSLLPDEIQQSSFLQIYFIADYNHQVDARLGIIPGTSYVPRKDILLRLQTMLHDINSYVCSFRYALDSAPSPNFTVVIDADKRPHGEHERRFNAPACNEIAAVIHGEQHNSRDIIISSRGNNLHRISETHRSYDALQYPLLFPYGEDGYHFGIPLRQPSNQTTAASKTVSCRAFYSYRFMVREGEFNLLPRCRQLFNQFAVDMAAKMESERLLYIKLNQTKLRSDSYIHLRDGLQQENDPRNIGKPCILPSTFTGGPRYMRERTQDALTYVRIYGRPDLFITYTCNPSCDEITRELLPGQSHTHRHDIVARVFRLNLGKMKDLIVKGQIFGHVRCHMFSVEWQKRGLPHAHILIWLTHKIETNDIDKFISAEIPDPDEDPGLYEIVRTTMVHGPCGPNYANTPCYKNGLACSKGFPKRFTLETQTGGDGYPLYKRRSPANGGRTITVGRHQVDNSYIVPYCPLLSKIFKAHVNVEFCSSIRSIQYVCKYINKGSDAAMFSIQRTTSRDEVSNYLAGRYLSSNEAFWRIYGFPLHQRHPAVVQLAVHLENGQRIYFTEQSAVQIATSPKDTTLTGFFKLCQRDDFARTLLYPQVPSYFVWSKNTWVRRKSGKNVESFPGVKFDSCLGRVYNIPPNQQECFYLRLLLHEVTGPTGFANIRTVNGVLCDTFREACMRLGLLEDDSQWDATMAEGALLQTHSALRHLFAILLQKCQLSDPLSLWMKYRDDMSHDFLRTAQQHCPSAEITFTNFIYNFALIQLEDAVIDMGGSALTEYGLPPPTREHANVMSAELLRETSYCIEELHQYVQDNEPRLLPDQRIAYNTIVDSVRQQRGGIFFLDAPGGTGKTFVTKLILAEVRRNTDIALAVASSGIAATLLPGGRTAHSAFRLPLDLAKSESPICNIAKNSEQADILRRCKLIVWDECTMAHKGALEALDRSLQDIRDSTAPMGGLTLLLSGDFRQTLPVIPKGTRADAVRACLKSSALWAHVRPLHLQTNMRAQLIGDSGSAAFSRDLLSLGENRMLSDADGYVQLDSLCTIVDTPASLRDAVFHDLQNNLRDLKWLAGRAILAPKNTTVNSINIQLLEAIPGDVHVYKSIDRTADPAQLADYPVEFLNSLEPPGLPPHILKLKVGAPIMLIRNLVPPKQCNGTRLVVKHLAPHLITATILTGCGKGEDVFIPRMHLQPSGADLPIHFRRSQFPVKLCFAMSINKSQGQTLQVAGLHLGEQCFAHGQLYVGCSRVGRRNDVFMFSPKGTARNIVYTEVFE